MIFPQEHSPTPTLAKRYRALAGPFRDEEENLFHSLADYLRRSGARIVSVGEAGGVTIFRLRSECETLDQTRNRLRRLR